MTIVARHVRVIGKVQGVFYRNWTVSTAQALGLTGWVRNRADGDVELVVQGKKVDVDRFLTMAWSGPQAARVEDVRDEHAEISDLMGFEQRATV